MARQLAIIIFRWPYLRVLGCYNLCVYSTWHLKGSQILLHILYKEPYLESDIVTPKFCNFVWDFTKIAGWKECFYLHYYTYICVYIHMNEQIYFTEKQESFYTRLRPYNISPCNFKFIQTNLGITNVSKETSIREPLIILLSPLRIW